MERLRDEKDQEIAILQEGMDATIQQLHESQQVSYFRYLVILETHSTLRTKALLTKRPMPR